MKTIIVTRHPGALNWLKKHHPELDDREYCPICGGRGTVDAFYVRPHATPEDVAGNRVIGILPNRLSCLAAEYWELDLPGLPAEARGKELSCEEMELYGAKLTRYFVLTEVDMRQLMRDLTDSDELPYRIGSGAP
jgi:putative CRISPR-associated protein (TIGR02620 family)